MNMSNLLPYRWRVKHQAGRHNEAIAAILDTPPLVPQRDGLVLFSMIGTAVVLPYLVAVKSLWQQLGRGRVAILDDGTLTAPDRAVLAAHLGLPYAFAYFFMDGQGVERIDAEDALAAAQLTARSVADAYARFVPEPAHHEENVGLVLPRRQVCAH